MAKYIQRVTDAEVRGPSGGLIDPGELAGVAPAVYEFLSLDVWEDAKKRETGTIMVMIDAGRWKAWVHDRDARRSCFVTAATPLGLLVCVEEILSNGGGDWRADGKGKGRS